MMKNLSSLFLVFLVFSIKSTACSYIELTNDGPVTIDTPITFKVENNYRTISPSYEYRFSFDQFPQHDKVTVSTKAKINYQVVFNASTTSRRDFDAKVDVWMCVHGVPIHSIGAVASIFKLIDYLRGRIEVHPSSVSTASPVKLTTIIYDPSGFLQSANISYLWAFNGSPEEVSYDAVILRNFTAAQDNQANVFVEAKTPNGLTKIGYFGISFQSKDPIRNLTNQKR